MNKKHVTLIVIIVLLSIVLVIGGTYAFFLANVSGNDDAELIKITAGDFELTFTDSSGIYFDNDIRPGTSASKTFTVQNTGTADDKYTFNYNIKLTELDVTYEKQDLVYTLQEYEDGTYETPKGEASIGYINKNTVNEDGEMYLAINIERPPKGTLHYYKLTIEFKKLDNVNQNYNQGKVFGGKINVDGNRDAVLYEQPTPFSEIIKVDDPNIFDDDPDNNLRYAGADTEVNNYIWFNCNSYEGITKDNATEKGCERWRIIGLFKNITKTEGGQEDLVKIIRGSVGNMAWDSTNSNNWAKPASLQTSLTDYYNGDKLSIAKGITGATQGMIEQVTWNIGGYNAYDTVANFYTAERGNTTYSSQPSTWDGYIGLMYPSDYAYATSGGDNVDRDTCLAYKLGSWNSGNYKTDCASNSWLLDASAAQWTLTPTSSTSDNVFRLYSDGNVNNNTAHVTYGVRPSLYLKSDVKVVNGKGTADEPYILQQGE